MSALATSPQMNPLNGYTDRTSLKMQPSGVLADSRELSVRVSQLMSYVKRRTERPEEPVEASDTDAQLAATLLEDGQNSKSSTAQRDSALVDMFSYQPLSAAVDLFISSKEWDGYVTELFDDKFRGVIYPILKGGEESEELIEIPLSFVDESVRGDIREGSVFRLATGQSKRKRQIMHGTKIYFRRAPRLRRTANVSASLKDLFAD